MESSVKERLIRYLKAKNLSQRRFETAAGLSNGYINNLKKSPSAEMMQKIFCAAPDLNQQWLMTGDGDMLVSINVVLDKDSSPCFDLATIQGGAGHGTGMEQLMQGMESGRMLVPGLKTGNDIPYIKVKGDSMLNRKNPARSIPAGAWLGVEPSTLSTIMWGEVYAIMTTDGPIVKKIVQSDKEGCIRCVSFNEEDGYAPFDLPYTDIIPPLYNIVGVVSVKPWE